MSLKDLNIEVEYRFKYIDIVINFYIFLLKEVNIYKRVVVYFLLFFLLEILIGICVLVKKGGKIKLVILFCFLKEDIEVIRKGYLKCSEVIKNVLLFKLEEVIEEFEKDRLDFLVNLIVMNILEIKIVLIEDGVGIFYEKVGIIEDDFGNKVVFSGLMNELEIVFKKNYEIIDVFCNWKIGDEIKRFEKKFDVFENMWNGNDKGIEVIDFLEFLEEIIKKYKRKE